MNKAKKVIIDTDAGIDDVVGIATALFSKELKIRLLTTVAGNSSVDKVTKNVLKLLAFWEKDIPVAIGSDRPLLREEISSKGTHYIQEMDAYNFPESKYELLVKNHAAIEMYKILMDSREKTTIIATGPLTNIAFLLRIYPECLEKIEELVIVGGSLGRGNQGILSEFNIAADPEAAKIVFESKITLTMIPLDAAKEMQLSSKELEKIKAMNKTGEMIGYFLSNRNNSIHLYSSCGIAYLLAPAIVEMQKAHVAIETQGILTAGATLVDLEGELGLRENCNVCVRVEEDSFKDWFLERVKQF